MHTLCPDWITLRAAEGSSAELMFALNAQKPVQDFRLRLEGHLRQLMQVLFLPLRVVCFVVPEGFVLDFNCSLPASILMRCRTFLPSCQIIS